MAGLNPEFIRHNLTQNDVVAIDTHILEAARHHGFLNDGQCHFALRNNAMQQHRLGAIASHQHALQLHIGCGAEHIIVLLGSGNNIRPLIKPTRRIDTGMGHHCQNPLSHFAIKAIHHRQYQN